MNTANLWNSPLTAGQGVLIALTAVLVLFYGMAIVRFLSNQGKGFGPLVVITAVATAISAGFLTNAVCGFDLSLSLSYALCGAVAMFVSVGLATKKL